MFELFNVINLVCFLLFTLVGLLNTAFYMADIEPKYEFAEKAIYVLTMLLYIEALVSCIAFLVH